MHNLKERSQKFLYNSLDASMFGVVTDSVTGASTLVIKDRGMQLPLPTGAPINVSIGCTEQGENEIVLLELGNLCPCQDCDYEYYLNIRKIVQKPGVFNDDIRMTSQPYTGTIDRVECTGGVLDDAIVLAMEDDLITQIHSDAGVYDKKKPLFDASRVYLVTLANTGTEAINVTIGLVTTTINLIGTHITDTTNPYTDGNTNIINATAAVNGSIRAIAVSATQMMIVGEPGVLFTIADGGGAATITIEARYLAVMSLNKDYQFMVEYKPSWATSHKAWFYNLSAPTAVTAAAIKINVNGTVSNVGESTVDATNLGNIQTPLTAAATGYVTYNDTADVFYVAGFEDLGMESLYVHTNMVATTVIEVAMTTGLWPCMGADDVFRLFNNARHEGNLGNQSYQVSPIQGAEYCHIHIDTKLLDIAQHGPNRYNYHLTEVDFYILKSELLEDHWTNGSWNDELEAAPDRNFLEMINHWSGVAWPII